MLFLQAQMRPKGGCSPLRRRLSLLILLIVLIFLLFAGRVQSASTACAIHVDVEQKMLTLFCGSEIAARYPIATGARDTPTPLGVFRINRRFSGEMGGFGTCFLGLNVPWGDYGIHGTNRPESIGTNASHGCIRMRVADAEALYARVPNGTVVVIECGAYGELGGSLRTLKTATAPAWFAPCSGSSARWASISEHRTAFSARRRSARWIKRAKHSGFQRTGW